MQTEVFRRLDEDSSSPAFWTLAQIKTALNEGYEEITDACEWNETSGTITTAADTTYYDLSSELTNFLAVRRIQNVTTSRWLTATHWRELDNSEVASWQAVDGEPQYWFLRGLDQLGLFPVGASSIKVYYTSLPTALSADGDTPTFPQEYHYSLVDYALYDLLAQEGETRKASRYWDRYLRGAAELKDHVQSRGRISRVAVLG